MGVEIERKFLVSNDWWLKEAKPGKHLRQGYLAFEPNEVRVRVIDSAKAVLTVKGRKSGDGTTRSEIEQVIALDAANAMLAQAAGAIIEKTRYTLPAGDLTWEIDVYSGALRGLVVAEIEIPSVDTHVAIPGWVGVEVTQDSAYDNSRLARDGLPVARTAKPSER